LKKMNAMFYVIKLFGAVRECLFTVRNTVKL
jgi:hypothetical protein